MARSYSYRLRDTDLLANLMAHPKGTAQGLSVRQLAERTSYSRSMIGALRAGIRSHCSREVAIAISQELGVHPHVLFVPPITGLGDSLSPASDAKAVA